MECVDGGEGGPPRRIDDSSLPYCAAQRNIGQEAGAGAREGRQLGWRLDRRASVCDRGTLGGEARVPEHLSHPLSQP